MRDPRAARILRDLGPLPLQPPSQAPLPKLQAVRGTRDLLPEESRKFRSVEETARRISKLYGFDEIETPIESKRSCNTWRSIVFVPAINIAPSNPAAVVLLPNDSSLP